MSSTGESYTRSYPAVASSVPRARSDVTEFALHAGACGERLDAVRLATSEAVTNAILHAYHQGGAEPPPGAESEDAIQVCVSFVEDELWVLVADDGGGLRSRPEPSTGLGLGLVLIAQLTDDFQLVRRGSGGTELRMRFKLRTGSRGGSSQPRGSVSMASMPA